MISLESKGSFKNTEAFLNKMAKGDIFRTLDGYGQAGVQALASATPTRTGLTAASWTYEVKKERGGWSISWRNTNMVDGTSVAILIQYGHGTGTGGYVQGRDFINPVIMPLFDKIAEAVWKEVTSA